MGEGTVVRLLAFVAAALSIAGESVAQLVLNAHPGPPVSGGFSGWAIFFNLEALRGSVAVTHLATATDAYANRPFTFQLLVRDGTALGGPVGTGPGSSMSGWTSLGLVQGVQGPGSEGISLDVDIPDIVVVPGTVRGVALLFVDVGPRFWDLSMPYTIFQDEALRLTTGDTRTVPFTAMGSYYPRAVLVGHLIYAIGHPCYANCDGSTGPSILNVNDFVCFSQRFAGRDPYANCDGSTEPQPLNVADFVCFMQQFAAGCR